MLFKILTQDLKKNIYGRNHVQIKHYITCMVKLPVFPVMILNIHFQIRTYYTQVIFSDIKPTALS